MPKTIAITGSSRGIGKATYDQLKKEGHKIIPLIRADGFDLKLPWDTIVNKLNPVLSKVDIFINNAHHGFQQVKILQHIHSEWRRKDNKMIINISSTGGDKRQERHGQWASYQIEKIALDEACKQLEGMGKCKVVNIRPGWVNTEQVEELKKPIGIVMLQPLKIAQVISYVINQPAEVHIKNISIEPWYKKSK